MTDKYPTIQNADHLEGMWDNASDTPGWLGEFVVFAWGMPYIVFQPESGDLYAHTVPDDGPDPKPTIRAEELFQGNTVHLLWDGRLS
jgi:hypothetical protein